MKARVNKSKSPSIRKNRVGGFPIKKVGKSPLKMVDPNVPQTNAMNGRMPQQSAQSQQFNPAQYTPQMLNGANYNPNQGRYNTNYTNQTPLMSKKQKK
jgi:hypothetical protein